MAVFLFEAPIPSPEEPDAVYCFGVLADSESDAKRIIKLLSKAEYIGEQWEPQTTALEVEIKNLKKLMN